MKYNNFETHIRESFLNDSAPVDTDVLIASLGIPVALEPKRRLAWWMLAGLALLSLLLVGLYYFTSAPLGSYVGDTSSMTIGMDINGNNNDTSLALAEDDESSNENISSQDSKNTENLTNQREVGNRKDETIENYSVEVNSVSDITIKKDKSQKVFQDSKSNKNSIRNSTNKLVTKQDEAIVIEATSLYENVRVNRNSKISKAIISDKEHQDRTLDPLFPIELLQSEIISDSEFPGLAEPECPSFSYRIPWNIALLAEVGVMKPMKDLENVGMDNSAFDLRERNENSKEAIQIGLHAKISKGSNPLYVRGGATYTRIAEQMNEEYDYIELDTMRGLISITTSMTGDTVTAIYGDVVSETRFTGKSVKHYYLHLLDIPVAIGYEIPIAGSFYAGAELGVQFNIRTSGSGLIFRDTNDYANLSDVTTKETKVGISYFGGFHFGKHLSKRSSVQLSARFRYYPSRFSSVDPSIEQRYNLAGLHAGYVFRF